MSLLGQALLEYYLFAVLAIWPAIVICRRAGLSPGWAGTLCVPWLGLLLYSCALALQRWPAVRLQVATP